MSTDSGQISFNNFGKVEKNAKNHIFIDFFIDFSTLKKTPTLALCIYINIVTTIFFVSYEKEK